MSVQSHSLQPLTVLSQMNESSLLFIIMPIIVGIYVGLVGYRNLYYSVLSLNASFFSCVLYYVTISVSFESFQKTTQLWRCCIELVCVIVSLLVSHLILRYGGKLSVHLFCGHVLFFTMLALIRLVIDLIVMKEKYLLM